MFEVKKSSNSQAFPHTRSEMFLNECMHACMLISIDFWWFCFHLCATGVSCRNGWTVWQIRWTNIRWESPKQPFYQVLWRSYSTDVEACWFPRQQQWHRSLPNHSWFEDKRSIWTDSSHQGWDSSSCKSLGIKPPIYTHIEQDSHWILKSFSSTLFRVIFSPVRLFCMMIMETLYLCMYVLIREEKRRLRLIDQLCSCNMFCHHDIY